MTEFEFLDVAVEDHVATVTMSRPPVNAVNQPMYADIKSLFSAIEKHAPGARVVILTGAGEHFCGGNDLEEFRTMNPANARVRMMAVREAFSAIYDSTLPVIAAVRGGARRCRRHRSRARRIV